MTKTCAGIPSSMRRSNWSSDTLLVGSYKNNLYTIDSSGEAVEFFADAKNRWIATPLMTEDAIYAPNGNGTLYALDFDGSVIWEFVTEAAIWATPVKDNGSLYVVSQDHIMYEREARSGDVVWSLDLGASSVNSPALDDNGILYIGTFNSELLAIDSKTGKIAWDSDHQRLDLGQPDIRPG